LVFVGENFRSNVFKHIVAIFKDVYPTLRKVDNSANGILKKKISQRTSKLKDPVKWSNENANPNNDDPVRTVKFFSGSTKSIKYLSKKFRENSQNPKLKHAGAFIFEIIGKLLTKKPFKILIKINC